MVIKPDYYDEFTCIAGACRHNCCIGWEIDIDSESLQKYQTETGAVQEKLQASIATEPCAHFILSKDERCPFLNADNLCELILYGGDGMLCQICRDHPRFYNDVCGVTEMGIGLCCEAAANLIVNKTTPMRLVAEGESALEHPFFAQRDAVFSIVQNRARPLTERIRDLLARLNLPLLIEGVDWIGVYKGLERLDTAWDERLDAVVRIREAIPTGMDIPFEQLLCYFLYRHLSGAVDDGWFGERVQFAVLSCYVIASMTRSVADVAELARMYSSEIEYSDENVDILLEKLQEYNGGDVIW